MNDQLTKKLSGILRQNLAKDFTSVSYAIMKNGKLIAADAIGTNGGKENAPSTINDTYNVASVSKIYCALAAMKLVEMGKLDLDTPIYQYLPRFKMLDERYKKITTRHCLSHTSGLPGTQWKGFSVTDVTADDYYDVVYEYMANNYLKAEPGEYAVYCNDGFTMAEMVIAQLSGMRFSKFCEKYITKPIGAKTTQTSDLLTGEHTLTREKKKPYELLYIQGGAGFTTSMVDLCKMGNMILHPEGVFEKSSIEEMAKSFGRTFLEEDDRSTGFGLGWDNVNYKDIDYDLGEGALQKGGNSFQFTTQFVVIPKYDAVLAISETHDCNIDVSETILRLFATAMLEEGVNIYTKNQPVPQEMIDKYAGKYIIPSGVFEIEMYGAHCNISRVTTRGDKKGVYKNLKFNGEVFEGENGQTFYFEEKDGEIYLITNLRGKRIPQAQKAHSFKPLSKAWEKRIGKQYVCITTNPYDLVIYELMTGFKLNKMEGVEGVMIGCYSGRDDADIYGVFEASVKEVDANKATGFINTPANGSRDLVTMIFRTEGGVEYCDSSSYTYRDVDSLPVYEGQLFHQDGKVNRVYKIEKELKELPEVPNGRRLMVLDKNLAAVYDSMYGGEFKGVKEGYISFI